MGLVTKMEIEMNYRRVMDKANELENLADNIMKTAKNDFAGALNNIGANWTGDNAANYLAKGSTLMTNIEKTAQELDKIASSLRSAAKRMYDAETRALEIATQRSYGGGGNGASGGGAGGGGFR